MKKWIDVNMAHDGTFATILFAPQIVNGPNYLTYYITLYCKGFSGTNTQAYHAHKCSVVNITSCVPFTTLRSSGSDATTVIFRLNVLV